MAGTFKNNAFGSYKLYSYTKTDLYLVVYHSGGVLVFTVKRRIATRNAYDLLEARVAVSP
jgi:hypothetical protein